MNSQTVDNRSVNSVTHRQALGMCGCVKVAIARNSKSHLDSCWKTTRQSGFSGRSRTEKYIENNETPTGDFYNYFKSVCPEYREAIKRILMHPINFQESDIKKIRLKKKYKKWSNRNISFIGVLSEVKEVENTKFYKIQIDEEFLWMEYSIEENREIGYVGTEIKGIGSLELSNNLEMEEALKTDFFISVFGIINMKEESMFYDPDYEEDLKIWGEGQVPEFREKR